MNVCCGKESELYDALKNMLKQIFKKRWTHKRIFFVFVGRYKRNLYKFYLDFWYYKVIQCFAKTSNH